MAEVYQAGRQLPAAATNIWVEAARRHLHAGREPVLDLGAGTGRFLAPLAQGLDARVIGLEPALGMRSQARSHIGPRISLVAGTALALPFSSGVFGGAWASQVLHHITDLGGCARELRRVLRAGGRVLVRGIYHDLRAQWPLIRYFPSVLSVAKRFSSLDEMRTAFFGAGFSELAHEHITQVVADDPEAFYVRTAQRADSGLALLTDRDFEAGLARLRDGIEAGECTGPVSEVLDLVVFG